MAGIPSKADYIVPTIKEATMMGFAILALVVALFGLGLIIISKNKRDGIRLLVVGVIGLIATFALSAAYFRH